MSAVIVITKLDNPGAGTKHYVSQHKGDWTLTQKKAHATKMDLQEARSFVASTIVHRLAMSLNGLTESSITRD